MKVKKRLNEVNCHLDISIWLSARAGLTNTMNTVNTTGGGEVHDKLDR